MQLRSFPTERLWFSFLKSRWHNSLSACVCLCVCTRVCVVSLLYIFAFVFPHGCVSILTFLQVKSGVSGDILLNSHHLKDEDERSWLNAQKYLTILASALVSALLLILTHCGKANPTRIWIKSCQHCVLDSLKIPRPEGGLSWSGS